MMKEHELRKHANCSVCGNKILASGLPLFWRVTVERSTEELPSKRAFQGYERVRASGLFNMITQATRAAQVAGLTRKEYRAVVRHYSELTDKYPDVRRFFREYVGWVKEGEK